MRDPCSISGCGGRESVTHAYASLGAAMWGLNLEQRRGKQADVQVLTAWSRMLQKAMRVITAIGMAVCITLLYAAAVMTMIILSNPTKPYPRTTILRSNGNSVGSILVEFGPS